MGSSTNKMIASQYLRIYEAAIRQMAAENSLVLRSEYLESAISAEGLTMNKVAEDAFDMLRSSTDQLNADEIEALLTLSDDLTGSTEGIDVLNRLLLLHNHHCHEDVAQLLQHGCNQRSVRYLATAVEQELDYLAWDVGKAFARKCIWALGAIGTDEAWSEIERFSRAKDPVIADWAREQLDRRTK